MVAVISPLPNADTPATAPKYDRVRSLPQTKRQRRKMNYYHHTHRHTQRNLHAPKSPSMYNESPMVVSFMNHSRNAEPQVPARYLLVFLVLEVTRNLILVNFGGWQRWVLLAPLIALLLTHIYDTIHFYREKGGIFAYPKHDNECGFRYWYQKQIFQKWLDEYCCNITETVTLVLLAFFFFIAYLIAILVRLLLAIKEDEKAFEKNVHYYIAAESVIYMLYLFLEIDYLNAFEQIQSKIQPYVEKFRLRLVLIGVILVFSISLVITLNLSDSESEHRFIHDSTFDAFETFGVWICFLLCVVLALINWDFISFQIANNEWVLSFIYFTMIGWVFMEIARWLHPPDRYAAETWAWHQRPKDLSKTVHYMIMLSLLGTFLLPFGAGILLATFAEVANAMSGGDGNVPGFVAFMIIAAFLIMAHLLMINPAAGASIIDLCGGFIFVPIFMKSWGMGFGGALGLAQIILLLSHFTGSSLQWWLGKKPSVQAWLNRITPVLVLAVLDSTLRDANWFQVGLIGGVFPDTINGFNQGRINMDFWTQFWSEWSALPNAAVMILNGAVLSQPNASLLTLFPIFVVIGIMVNVAGVFYATRALYEGVGEPAYLTSYSKWTLVQGLQSFEGLVPTKTGWEKDVYQMATEGGLFDVTFPIQLAKIRHLKEIEESGGDPTRAGDDAKLRMELTEVYDKLYLEMGQDHFQKKVNVKDNLKRLQEDDLLVFNQEFIQEREETRWKGASFLDNEGNPKTQTPPLFKYQLLYLVGLYITFAASAFIFRIALEETVTGGYSQIAKNQYYPIGLFCLVLHFIIAGCYFSEKLGPLWESCVWFGAVLKRKILGIEETGVGADIETDFDTPQWKRDIKSFDNKICEIMKNVKRDMERKVESRFSKSRISGGASLDVGDNRHTVSEKSKLESNVLPETMLSTGRAMTMSSPNENCPDMPLGRTLSNLDMGSNVIDPDIDTPEVFWDHTITSEEKSGTILPRETSFCIKTYQRQSAPEDATKETLMKRSIASPEENGLHIGIEVKDNPDINEEPVTDEDLKLEGKRTASRAAAERADSRVKFETPSEAEIQGKRRRTVVTSENQRARIQSLHL